MLRVLCHSYSPSPHKEQKVCQPLCHISAEHCTVSSSYSFSPPRVILRNSFPYHFTLPTSLFVSAPPSQLSRVSPTPPVGQRGKFNNFKVSCMANYVSYLKRFPIIGPDVTIVLQQYLLLSRTATKQTSICRNKCVVAATTAAFCNPAMAVCQSESVWDREGEQSREYGGIFGEPLPHTTFIKDLWIGVVIQFVGHIFGMLGFPWVEYFFTIHMGWVWPGYRAFSD